MDSEALRAVQSLFYDFVIGKEVVSILGHLTYV
jgi:hypothetical protein